MSAHDSAAQVTRAMKDLLLRWDRTKSVWRDRRATEFEKSVLEPLAADVKTAADAMDQLGGAIDRARRDCSS